VLFTGGIVLSLLVFGSAWFYIVAFSALLTLIALVESDKWGWATITMLSTFGALALFGDVNLFKFVLQNPLQSLFFVGAYVLIGAVWSVVKWWFYVRKWKDEYDDKRAYFLNSKGELNGPVPENLRKSWAEECRYYTSSYNDSRPLNEPPTVRGHKSRITTWLAYWPPSMIWTLLNDPIKRLYRFVYTELQAVYQSIVDKVHGDVKKDFAS
jgi:hypothetical protein